jgi:hypothetical protein
VKFNESVRAGVERRRGVCVGIETEGWWAERNILNCTVRQERKKKSLRNGVHHANGVVWGPV